MRLRHALSLAFAISTLAAPSFAQSDADKKQARMYSEEGQTALDARDYKTAEEKFKRAYALFPSAPTLALGLARAQAGAGKVVAAQETYNKIIREGAPPGNQVFQKAVDDAKAEIGAVAVKVAYATINVTGPDSSKVTLDDQPLPWAALGGKRPVDPGDHVVKAIADGYAPAESRFHVEAGKETQVNLTMNKEGAGGGAVVPPPPGGGGTPSSPPPGGGGTPSSPPPGGGGAQPPPSGGDTGTGKSGSSTKTLGFVALGVGGAGLALGAITGFMAMGKHGTLKDNCTLPSGGCPASQQDTLDSFHTMGTISTIGFIVAGVGAAAGAVLILTAPKEGSAAAFVSPYVGPGSVGATGRF